MYISMATLQSSSFLSSSSSTSHKQIKATLQTTNLHNTSHISLPKLQLNGFQSSYIDFTPTTTTTTSNIGKNLNSNAKSELYSILEFISDRCEMHKNISIQRDNWNHLLLTSVNGITLTASLMAGLGATTSLAAPLLALKLSSTSLYVAATAILMVMNQIQPSQLAEEQRNAARLFKQLYKQIETTLALGNPDFNYVNDAMEKVLALDKAYPLPLLGTMLEKFPKKVEPAMWWPKDLKSREKIGGNVEKNGWDEELEKEMKEIVDVLTRKDTAEYVRLSNIVLKVNKVLAICGPVLTGLGALGSAFLSHGGSWGVILGVVCGAFATVVNTLEHGGQVGMVFEMYRNSAGFFRQMEESIELNLKERENGKRENGEIMEVKVALQLGRSLAELRDLTSDSSRNGKDVKEFASKLF